MPRLDLSNIFTVTETAPGTASVDDIAQLRVSGADLAATTIASPGTVTAKLEIFDADGVSIGFLPIYAAIT